MRLRQEPLQAIQSGYTHFISGFAAGVDLIFAETVAGLKQAFQCLLEEWDTVKVHTNQYSKSCYMVRNRYMVDYSALVIAVHDGRKGGGTAATIRYAHQMACDVKEIRL